MPRIKRRAMRMHAWTRQHLHQLCTGYSSVAGGFGKLQALHPEHEFDEDAARACWQEFGARIIAHWVELNPGTRPWGWWRWDSPERRRRIGSWRMKRGAKPGPNGCYAWDSDRFVRNKKPHPFDNPERQALARKREAEYPGHDQSAYELDFGEPSCEMLFPDDSEAAYETEAGYLERLGLAAGDECERWKTSKYQEGTEVYAVPNVPDLRFIDALLDSTAT